jgi:hypothetical protein
MKRHHQDRGGVGIIKPAESEKEGVPRQEGGPRNRKSQSQECSRMAGDKR